jgi:Zn-dependent peptidase ImmA (M78 family)/fido (protein-threonine AMPylation protein)
MILKIQEAVRNKADPEELSDIFLKEYFGKNETVYPINPFQMLTDLGIPFTFRSFKKYEGVYIPAESGDDSPIVGINIKRPITRQRYTAAHEICHHIKDANSGFICPISGKNEIEKYAEKFAAALLMPLEALCREVSLYEKYGHINFEGILRVAVKFGVSFESCLFRIAYKLHKIEGDTQSDELKKRILKFKPDTRKRELGLNDVILYESLFDAAEANMKLKTTEYVSLKFQHEYVYYDSRMEGVNIEQEKAAEIVTDIRLYKQKSVFCVSENEDILQVAGLAVMYNSIFSMVDNDTSIFDSVSLNRHLYSCVPYPEYGGRLREVNTLVTGAKFETEDYKNIYPKLLELDDDVNQLICNCDNVFASEYIKAAIRIHYRMTVIHPFNDGNGRTSRGFFNLLMAKRKLPPVFFNQDMKEKYKAALSQVDETGDYTLLYEIFFKVMLKMHSDLTDFIL